MDKIILSNPQVALKVLTNPYAEKKLNSLFPKGFCIIRKH